MISNTTLKAMGGDPLLNIVHSHFKGSKPESLDIVDKKYMECLKYLFLLSKYHKKASGKFMPLVGEVDEVWHFLIIQTREYEKLCFRFPGKVFLHHQSFAFQEYINSHKNREDIIKEMLFWVPLYVSHFGSFNEQNGPYWKIVKYLQNSMGMTYEKITGLR